MDSFRLRDVAFKMLVRNANVGIKAATENVPLVSRGEAWAGGINEPGALKSEGRAETPGESGVDPWAPRLPLLGSACFEIRALVDLPWAWLGTSA